MKNFLNNTNDNSSIINSKTSPPLPIISIILITQATRLSLSSRQIRLTNGNRIYKQ